MKPTTINRLLALAAAVLFAAGSAQASVDWDVSNPVNFNVAWDGDGTNNNLVSCATGDLNGDGIPDLVLYEYGASSLGRAGNGSVFVVYGPMAGVGTVKSLQNPANYNVRIDGPAAGDNLGSVCYVFDVNNDGQEDLIVQPQAGPDLGNLYVLYGPLPSGVGNEIDLSDLAGKYNVKITMPANNGGIMWPFMADVNNDHVDDLLIEVPRANTAAADSGALYVLYGGAAYPWPVGTGNVRNLSNAAHFNVRIDGPPASTLLTATCNGGWYHCGANGTAVGDLNGDGINDLAIPANNADTQGRTDNGAVYVTTGPLPSGTGNVIPLGTAAKFMVRYDGPNGSQFVDRAVIGDFNGDGHNDLCMASPYEGTLGRSANGAVWCVLGPLNYAPGTAIDLANSANWNVEFHGANSNDNLAFNSLRAVDVNNDGVADLVMESQYFDAANYDEGALYFIYGGASWPAGTGNSKDLSTTSNFNVRINNGGGTNYDGIGETLSLFKDMDGDGVTDVVVSYRSNSNDNFTCPGSRVAIFYGPLPSGNGIVKLVQTDFDYRVHNGCAGSFGYPYIVTADFDRDGVKDLALGYMWFDSGQFQNNGRTFFVSVATAGPRIYAPYLFTNLSNPTLAWLASPGASTYRLQVGLDPLFLSPIVDQTVLATQQAVSGLTDGQTYYARVQAQDGSWRRWSPIVNFTVATSPLTAPIPISPGNDSGNPPAINTQTPVFNWTGSRSE